MTGTDYDIYGTSTHSVSELAHLIASHFQVLFVERESDYRGVYYHAQSPYGDIEIQPNAIPGDDDRDDVHTPEHPAIPVLLLTRTSASESTLHNRLSTLHGLVHLGRESS